MDAPRSLFQRRIKASQTLDTVTRTKYIMVRFTIWYVSQKNANSIANHYQENRTSRPYTEREPVIKQRNSICSGRSCLDGPTRRWGRLRGPVSRFLSPLQFEPNYWMAFMRCEKSSRTRKSSKSRRDRSIDRRICVPERGAADTHVDPPKLATNTPPSVQALLNYFTYRYIILRATEVLVHVRHPAVASRHPSGALTVWYR